MPVVYSLRASLFESFLEAWARPSRLRVATHETTQRNLWDSKHNGTTTFMFDSRNTWNVIYIAQSNRSHIPTSPNTAAATKSRSWTAPNIAPATKTECATWMQLHQILRLPQKVYYSLTLPFFFSTFPWLYYYFTLLFFDSRVLLLLFFDSTFHLLYYSFALTFFDSTILLHHSFTLLFFYYTIILFFYSTGLLLYHSLTLLCFYSTILLLYYSFSPLFYSTILSLTLLFFCSSILWRCYSFILILFYSIDKLCDFHIYIVVDSTT